MFLAYVFQSISLYLLIKKVDKNYKYRDAFILTIAGLFFNAITPCSSGGQPFQIYMLSKQNVKVGDAGNILLQNFITYQSALIIVGTFAIVMNYMFGIFPSSSLLKQIVFLGYLINVTVLIFIVVFSYAKKLNTTLFNKVFDFLFKFKLLKNKTKRRKKLNEMLDNFYEGSVSLKKNKDVFCKSFIFNFLALLCIYSIPLLIFYSLGDFKSLSLRNSIVSSGYTYLIGSFVPIPGSAGGLEFGFNEFFSVFRNGGFLSACLLIWRFITYYFGMIIGGISLLYSRGEEK